MAKVLNAMLWTGFGGISVTFIKFIVLIIAARLISPEQFGIVSIALILSSFFTVTIKNGVITALVRKSEVSNIEFSIMNNFCFFIGFLLTIIFFLFANFIGSIFGNSEITIEIRMISIIFLIIGLSTVPHSIILRNKDFKELSRILVLSCLFGYGIISIIFAFAGYQSKSLILGLVSQELIALILMSFYAKIKWTSNFNLYKSIEILNFAYANSLANLLNFLASEGDKVIVGSMLGLKSLGFYGRSYQIMSLPSTYLGKVVDTVFFPIIASFKNDDTRISEMFLKSFRAIFILFAPLSTLIINYSEPIVLLLLGNNWLPVAPLIEILAFGMVFKLLHKLNSSLIKAKGGKYDRTKVQFVYALITLVGCFYAINSGLGIEGVAIAVLIAVLIVFILLTELSLSIIGFKQKKRYFLYLFGFLIHVLDWFIYKIIILFAAPLAISNIGLILSAIISLIIITSINIFIYRITYNKDYIFFKKSLLTISK